MTLKEKYIKETPSNKLSEGLLSVNGKYYLTTFKETDKYNEDRYFFQSFNIDKFLKKFDKNKDESIEDYVEEFKLEVIEDSTYKIKKVKIKKKR